MIRYAFDWKYNFPDEVEFNFELWKTYACMECIRITPYNVLKKLDTFWCVDAS